MRKRSNNPPVKRRPDRVSVHRLATEQANPSARNLDCKSSLEIARLINAEDAKVANALKRVLPQIARAIDTVAGALRRGGRLIYVGAGTSGRLAALDASEAVPTFNVSRHSVQFLMAGGQKALAISSEATEDDVHLAQKEMRKRKPGKNDVVIGIASSGRTPFTVTAVEIATRRGAKTIALTCNRNSPLQRVADFAIVTEVGPEVLTGSSRMKSGTAHKMVLNMISTGAMVRLGYVYGNLMVNISPKNEKLRQRAVGIIQAATGADEDSARQTLKAAANSTQLAVVMLAAGVTRPRAKSALDKAKSNVRQAIALASRR